MSSEPLLVAASSQRQGSTHFESGAATKASGLPERTHQGRASGFNSLEPGYGDCRHCPSSWNLTADGRVPPHADRRVRHGLNLRPVCTGSGEAPVPRLDADSEA